MQNAYVLRPLVCRPLDGLCNLLTIRVFMTVTDYQNRKPMSIEAKKKLKRN